MYICRREYCSRLLLIVWAFNRKVVHTDDSLERWIDTSTFTFEVALILYNDIAGGWVPLILDILGASAFHL